MHNLTLIAVCLDDQLGNRTCSMNVANFIKEKDTYVFNDLVPRTDNHFPQFTQISSKALEIATFEKLNALLNPTSCVKVMKAGTQDLIYMIRYIMMSYYT